MDRVKPECYPCPCDFCCLYKDALIADFRSLYEDALEYDPVIAKSVAQSTFGLSVIDVPSVSSPVVDRPAVSSPVMSSPCISSPSVNQAPLSSPTVSSSPVFSSPTVASPSVYRAPLSSPTVSQAPLFSSPVVPSPVVLPSPHLFQAQSSSVGFRVVCFVWIIVPVLFGTLCGFSLWFSPVFSFCYL